MGAQFTIPLVTVIPGQLIASALWNGEFNNIAVNLIPAGIDSYSDTDAQMQIQTNPFPGGVTSHATSLGGEIERIRYQISQMLGITTPDFWYAKPPIDLTTLSNISIPIGGIMMMSVDSAPANFLTCAGQAISRVVYSVLFNLLNSNSPPLPYGSGDGSTTFNIPNFTDRFPVGFNGAIAPAVGNNGGATSHTLLSSEIPATSVTVTDPGHTHTQNAHNHGITDPGHTHIEKGDIGNGGGPNQSTIAMSQEPQGGLVNNAAASTASATTGISTNNTTATENSSTTGITAAVAGGGGSHSILNPYLGIAFYIRVL